MCGEWKQKEVVVKIHKKKDGHSSRCEEMLRKRDDRERA